MARRRKETFSEVQLLGVPHYMQGEADGLCVYYAMSMLLAAVHPQCRPTIHDAPKYKRKGSPVFQTLRRRARGSAAFKQRVADWFFEGMRTTDATKLLNEIFRELNEDKRTYFLRRRVRSRRTHRLKYNRRRRALEQVWTVRDILNAVTWHLPVIVSGGGFESHAVLIVGYSIRGTRSQWIYYLDPADVRVECRPAGEVFVGDADAIIPYWDEAYFLHRPPALITTDGNTKLQGWPPSSEEDSLTKR